MAQMMRCSCAVLCAAALVAAVFTTTTGAQQGSPQIRVLSSRPDLVSGGDALVQVEPPGRVAPATLKVTVNGTDVTSALTD